MSRTLRVPSLEQVSAAAVSARALGGVVGNVSCVVDPGEAGAWSYEERLAEALSACADALRPLRNVTEGDVAGWEDHFGVWIAVRDLPAAMDEIARCLSLERLTDPPYERQAFIAERVAQWRKDVAGPFFDAAISAQRGFTLWRSFQDINYWANIGRADGGYQATMAPEKGESRYPDAYQVFRMATRLGATLPFGDGPEHDEKRRRLNLLPGPLFRAAEGLERALEIERRGPIPSHTVPVQNVVAPVPPWVRAAVPAPPKPDSAALKQSDTMASAAAKPISAAEANVAAREYLAKEKDKPTLRGCAAYIRSKAGGSFADGRVSNLPAWTAHMEEKRSRKPGRGASVGAIPLTEAMLATRESQDARPDDIAAENESRDITERRYLEEANPAAKADYYKMTEEQKLERLGAFLAGESDGG